MSGVPGFTAGELDAVLIATGLARDVAASVVAYAPTGGVEEVYDDLTNALAKLTAMRGQIIEDDQEVPADGAADSL